MSSNGTALQEWQEIPLREMICGKLQNGAFVQKPEKGRGLLFANVVNMYGGIHLNYDTLERLSVNESDIERYKLNEGDVLVVRSSLKREGIGQSCIATNLPETVFYDCHLIRVVPDQTKVLPAFLSFYWRSPVGKQDLINRSKTTTMTTINQAGLSGAIVPLPPLPEQKKIAHILSTVQQAIEAQERIIQTTTELKKALMHKFFTEGLRNEPQKQTEIGPVPESWVVIPLSDCAVVQTGIAKGRKVKAEEAIEVPYLRVANVQDGYLDLSEIKTITIRENEQQRFALQNGDVVLTEGGDFDKLGRGFIWHGQIDNCVHQNHVFAVRPDTSRISSEFFAYQSQSPYGKNYFLSVAHKTTNLACINTTKLKAFPVLLPPQDQQKEIVDTCHRIDEKIQVTRSRKTQLQDLFRTFLHELMTAKTRVHAITFPPIASNS